MNTNTRVSFFLITLCLSSCGFPGLNNRVINSCSFLTGECLASPTLIYYQPDTPDRQIYGDHFVFSFSLDLSSVKKEWYEDNTYVDKWRNVPSEEAFLAFGKYGQRVKNEFDRIYNAFSESYQASFLNYFSFITILYNGGISLIADKEFAGRKAGVELGDLITCHPMYHSIVKETGIDPVVSYIPIIPGSPFEILGIPSDYISLLGGFAGKGIPGVSFSIPIEDKHLIDETVSFELNIPVKKVMYLTWINNKLKEPDAPILFRDEVLHCSFSTKYGLK